jgi:hypothetical protein
MPTSRVAATYTTSIPDTASGRARRSRISSSREHEALADSSTIVPNFGEMVESENYVPPELNLDLG